MGKRKPKRKSAGRELRKEHRKLFGRAATRKARRRQLKVDKIGYRGR